jgi:hypothetical protein
MAKSERRIANGEWQMAKGDQEVRQSGSQALRFSGDQAISLPSDEEGRSGEKNVPRFV